MKAEEVSSEKEPRAAKGSLYSRRRRGRGSVLQDHEGRVLDWNACNGISHHSRVQMERRQRRGGPQQHALSAHQLHEHVVRFCHIPKREQDEKTGWGRP